MMNISTASRKEEAEERAQRGKADGEHAWGSTVHLGY